MPGTPREHLEYTIEEWTGPFAMFIDALKDIKTVFDVGANAGGFSKVIKMRFPEARIFTFEPIEDNFNFLADQLPNEYHCLCAIQYGTDRTRMFWRGGNIGAYFTEEVNAGDDKFFSGETVDCKTLESVGVIPDLVKLDVEGAEENIIEYSTLLKTVRYIILEWHPDHIPVLPFLEKHLPNHEIKINMENKQFLLCLK